MDTIAAIATPIGTSGIGIVRVSGPRAIEIASRLFVSASNLKEFASHRAYHGKLVTPILEHPTQGDEKSYPYHSNTSGAREGEPIDEVVLTVFRAPFSYTGEDVVEFSCHGGIAILRKALGAVLDLGARLAEPGEFTKRAFLNGKIDLAQAEAVNDLIRARTEGARRIAFSQLDGAISSKVRGARDRILGVIAAIEAAIDFPDDVDEPDRARLESEISAVRQEVVSLLSTFAAGRIFREGLRVVIAGRVNVGKSSLLNALLRHARAIVTPIPGTTRDVIEESLEIHGIPIVALDTAGIRSTDDPVEKIGVELAERTLESADLVLMVFDISEGINQEDLEILDRLADKPTIAVLNKIDLLPEEARGLQKEEYVGRLGRSLPAVWTCASSGQGIDELEDAIAETALREAMVGPGEEAVVVTNIRHQQALLSALESLDNALETLSAAQPIDLLSVDLASARNSLGLITGETASDDLIDRIFSDFCIGK
ncbi:MAG: tRNA uridine-5-carboxymethylaminomethyl(34) synthesis GTPase MnmE [Armatimonadetes bacterium]|nr:tRNA uridine-5-carboxymethylaminomethyl(34) synthesis GTPase MnmE [Armatimonadota bacterium]